MWLITDFLPLTQPETEFRSVQISYFLQNCKKGKSLTMSLPILKNDITTFEQSVGIADT
jgi:hypothetical protein